MHTESFGLLDQDAQDGLNETATHKQRNLFHTRAAKTVYLLKTGSTISENGICLPAIYNLQRCKLSAELAC